MLAFAPRIQDSAALTQLNTEVKTEKKEHKLTRKGGTGRDVQDTRRKKMGATAWATPQWETETQHPGVVCLCLNLMNKISQTISNSVHTEPCSHQIVHYKMSTLPEKSKSGLKDWNTLHHAVGLHMQMLMQVYMFEHMYICMFIIHIRGACAWLHVHVEVSLTSAAVT